MNKIKNGKPYHYIYKFPVAYTAYRKYDIYSTIIDKLFENNGCAKKICVLRGSFTPMGIRKTPLHNVRVFIL